MKSVKITFSEDLSYLSGKDEFTGIAQPIKITIGDQSWRISNLQTTWKRHPYWVNWFSGYANAFAAIINNDGFTSQVDSNDPNSLIINSANDINLTDIVIDVDRSVGGQGVNSIFNGTDPYALPKATVSATGTSPTGTQ